MSVLVPKYQKTAPHSIFPAYTTVVFVYTQKYIEKVP